MRGATCRLQHFPLPGRERAADAGSRTFVCATKEDLASVPVLAERILSLARKHCPNAKRREETNDAGMPVHKIATLWMGDHWLLSLRNPGAMFALHAKLAEALDDAAERLLVALRLVVIPRSLKFITRLGAIPLLGHGVGDGSIAVPCACLIAAFPT